jgi:hypothetical protein
VASLQRTISIETRTCVSPRWLGRSLHLLPRAVRSSRSCHVYHWSSRARSNSRNEEGLINLLTQPLISRWSREAKVPRAVVQEDRALRGIGHRELETRATARLRGRSDSPVYGGPNGIRQSG